MVSQPFHLILAEARDKGLEKTTMPALVTMAPFATVIARNAVNIFRSPSSTKICLSVGCRIVVIVLVVGLVVR